MKKTFLLLCLTLPAWATELPPVIPVGPITYDDVSYAPAAPGTPATPATTTAETTDPFATPGAGAADPFAPWDGGSFVEPTTPSAHSDRGIEAMVNVYSSAYQVRGMGVTNTMSDHGYSDVRASYTLPNRNLFRRGIYARVGGEFGIIWDANEVLGDTPMFRIEPAVGKEIFPNLMLELGYTLYRGGLQGYMAAAHNRAAHRVAQDATLTLAFNDRQRGFFGHFQWGYGIQGLKGHYFDLEMGYRIMDVLRDAKANADVEVSAGVSTSFGYWGSGVEGVDAYRFKVALLPYSHNGKIGRDGRWHIKPWVQYSWTADNAKKIDRITNYGFSPIDHSQLAAGIEAGFKF